MKLEEYAEVLGILNRWIRETNVLDREVMSKSKAGSFTLLSSDVLSLRRGLERAQQALIEQWMTTYTVARYEEALEKGVPYGHG